MKITVVGGGRMGLPLACAMAGNGAVVTVSDIDPGLVESINSGTCPYEEPGLAALLQKVRASGNLSATLNTAAASADSDAIIIIVPAHLTPDREIDFSVLKEASAAVGNGLRPGALIVYETTVSIGGTRRHLIPVLEEHSALTAGDDFLVAYSPERVKANLVLERLASTPKVVGGLDPKSLASARDMYKTYLGAPVDEVGSIEAAETTKLLGMLYRDVNIALANELAAYCEIAGVDFEKMRIAANRDGEANLLVSGIGVGGHCTPVYPYFLTRESKRLGMVQRLSEAAREINDFQPSRQLDRVEKHWKPVLGQNVHILGLGFRPGVKVDTFSPAYSIRDELLRRGAKVTIEDPLYVEDEILSAGFTPGEAKAASLVILNTAHAEFAAPDFPAWSSEGVQAILDGRSCWDQFAAESAGLLYFGIGRSSEPERVQSPGAATCKSSELPLE